MARRLKKVWSRLSLAKQFAIAASAVLIVSMATLGTWVAGKIEEDVTQNTASATALYVSSFIAPMLQDLAHQKELSPKSQAALDGLFASTELGKRVLSYKIWKEDGLVVYASNKPLIGKRFKPSENLKRSWQGVVSSEFDNLSDAESELEQATRIPLLEVYVPVREKNTERIIAVAEFYTVANTLRSDLLRAKLQSWLLVALLTLATIAALSIIVRRGSRTIEQQRGALERRVTDLSSLLAQNEELRSRVELASERAVEINERFLRRVGAELHDGPAQLLGLSLLRLDSLKPLIGRAENGQHGPSECLETIRNALSDALQEIRNLSAGLALPEIEKLSLEETLQIAVHKHEKRTGTRIKHNISSLPKDVASPLKICLYRFTQEALNNAFRHANGKGQSVRAEIDEIKLEVKIEDSGLGFEPSKTSSSENRLGLTGMRERVESLGGVFTLQSKLGKGTCVTASFPTHMVEMRRDR
ncbi:signal transduction histidine-protein kinase/phosphatase DegS [bacterium MnTg02]|nr:signal transduction histidine-protein kinase/phosphatase DegS [bacterium MnTg02]